MKRAPIRLGPLAMLLTVISLCLATLAVLVFTTARADRSMAEKYAETVRVRYELEAEGQSALAQLASGMMPDAAETEEDCSVRLELSKNGSLLRIGLAPEGDGYRVVLWRHEREWTQDDILDNLWTG